LRKGLCGYGAHPPPPPPPPAAPLPHANPKPYTLNLLLLLLFFPCVTVRPRYPKPSSGRARRHPLPAWQVPTYGLVFKAHRLLYHSTLDLRVIQKKKERRDQFMRRNLITLGCHAPVPSTHRPPSSHGGRAAKATEQTRRPSCLTFLLLY